MRNKEPQLEGFLLNSSLTLKGGGRKLFIVLGTKGLVEERYKGQRTQFQDRRPCISGSTAGRNGSTASRDGSTADGSLHSSLGRSGSTAVTTAGSTAVA